MTQRLYHNPVLAADWSDPDAIRVGDDFYLVASSFHRVPGLPILHSRNLVDWTIVGHALDRLEPATEFATPQHGRGIWAPAIRFHAGLFWIFYPDPDRGIFVTTAPAVTGPWRRPQPLKSGRGLIDPCPLWDTDGTAYLVHAWARSRAGFNNRITCHRMSPDATRLLDDGRTIIDGDRIPGCRTLEGPKAYRRGDRYWIFAPAGGVADGWQYAFRARRIYGPYEHRIVLARGDTEVNGPHQGAWLDTSAGQHWFLHFQDRGAHGRVVYLQPMRWAEDDWPRIGDGTGAGPGTPVRSHPVPAVGRDDTATDVPADDADGTATGGDLATGRLGPQWYWPANPRSSWWSPGPPGALRLACVRSAALADLRQLPNVLGQRLPADPGTVSTTVTLHSDVPGARAGLTILGRGYAWIGLERTATGIALVHRTAPAPGAASSGARTTGSGGGVGGFAPVPGPAPAETDLARPVPLPTGQRAATLRIHLGPGAVCRFAAAPGQDPPVPLGTPFVALPGHWVGATVGLFAAAPPGDGPAGHAEISRFTMVGS
ncbi:family 43 glycosylhydrolase [Plantactinospora solaniradicis]|uniref:Family 43 glycosylhydrolase n=1 Tax=Plantactinospora solaniradicis TaxID=1723736 RepID=A0ABW1KIE9_9ACTN